jgi:hypothetical protein
LAEIEIHADYRHYTPPDWVHPTVKRLLASVPAAHLHHLASIVLTECAVATTRKGSRSMRKNRRGTPLGRYHPAWNSQPAWIEIVVDQVVAELSQKPLANLQFSRDHAVGRVLFHEIGHHLDRTTGAAARSGEPAAEKWMRTLWRQHARRHYWYLRPLRPVFAVLAKFFRFVAARQRAQRQPDTST